MSQKLSTPNKISERLGAKAVLVVWDDAVNQLGWVDGEKMETLDGTVETVGWLMENTGTHLLIAQSLTDGSHGQTLQLPIGMVKSIATLEV